MQRMAGPPDSPKSTLFHWTCPTTIWLTMVKKVVIALPFPLLLPPWFWLQKFPAARRVPSDRASEHKDIKRGAKGQVQGCPFVNCPPPSGASKACACTWHHLMLRRLQKCSVLRSGVTLCAPSPIAIQTEQGIPWRAGNAIEWVLPSSKRPNANLPGQIARQEAGWGHVHVSLVHYRDLDLRVKKATGSWEHNPQEHI